MFFEYYNIFRHKIYDISDSHISLKTFHRFFFNYDQYYFKKVLKVYNEIFKQFFREPTIMLYEKCLLTRKINFKNIETQSSSDQLVQNAYINYFTDRSDTSEN